MVYKDFEFVFQKKKNNNCLQHGFHAIAYVSATG